MTTTRDFGYGYGFGSWCEHGFGFETIYKLESLSEFGYGYRHGAGYGHGRVYGHGYVHGYGFVSYHKDKDLIDDDDS